MLNLIASDLYRITRPRGLRGSIWQYGIALLAAYALVVGLMMFAKSQTFADLAGGHSATMPSDFASYTAYMASMMSGVVSLCASFMTVENAQQDFKNGYAKSVLTARVGRLSYILGKVLFAGVISALVIALAAVIVSVGTAAAGFTFASMDSLAGLVGWFAGFWVNTWALSVLSLVLVYATRSAPVSYLGAVFLYSGFVPQLLRGLAYSSGGILSFLEPVAPVFETLAAWMPTSALSNLESGGSLFFKSAAAVWGSASRAFVINPGIQAVLTGLIWIVFAAAVVLAISRKRDI